jgi:hypothetical protein
VPHVIAITPQTVAFDVAQNEWVQNEKMQKKAEQSAHKV